VGFEDKVQAYQVATLQVMDADGSNPRVLTAKLDRSVSSPVWRDDGDGLFFRYAEAGGTRIGYVGLNGQRRDVVTDMGGTIIGRPYPGGAFSVAGNGAVAYTRASPRQPAQLGLLPRAGREVRSVVALNDDLLGQRTLGEVEEIWYASSFDQRRLQGWIVRPPDFDPQRRYPLLVENHGGPILHYGPYFSMEVQLYAAAGYVVFYANPRGSTSYGEEFGNLLFHNYPGEDYLDVMDGVDAVIDTGYVDPQQLFVTGGSAGGIMTAWIVGKNQRFRAAVVAKPVMNWFSKTLTADNYYSYANYRLPGQPWENIEAYMKSSPISLVGNVQTPTLVMVGTADLRTPLSEAKQLYHALKLRGIDTALVEITDASHSIAHRPSQLITKVAHTLAWFDKYRDAPSASAPAAMPDGSPGASH
jgi:dipeptidyl aminopeptidase/acylaminoacyl peptidase